MSNKKRNPLQEKRDLREHIESARKGFNSSLHQLIDVASHKNQDDDNIQKIKETLSAIQAADNTIIILQAGPYIWKYREFLANKDEKFFLDNDFKKDIDERKARGLGKLNVSNQDFSDNEVANIMQSIKGTYKSMSPPEKEIVWRHVTDLLKFYAQYLSCDKKLEKLNKEILTIGNA